MKETRSEKFKRLAERRTNEVINKISLIGNLSNKSNYDYSEKDVKKIFSAIENELKYAKQRFKIKRSKREFKL